MELTRQARNELVRMQRSGEVQPGDVLRLRVHPTGGADLDKGAAKAGDCTLHGADGAVLVADAADGIIHEHHLLHYVRDAGPLGSGKRWVMLERRIGEARSGLAAPTTPVAGKRAMRIIPRLLGSVLHALR